MNTQKKKSTENGINTMKESNYSQSTESTQMDKKELTLETDRLRQVENTPFCIAAHENIVLILMGNQVIKTCENEDVARKLIENRDWEIILTAGAIYNEYIKNIKN